MGGNVASGALLVIIGMWTLMQTIAGDLPGRLLSLGSSSAPYTGALSDPSGGPGYYAAGTGPAPAATPGAGYTVDPNVSNKNLYGPGLAGPGKGNGSVVTQTIVPLIP